MNKQFERTGGKIAVIRPREPIQRLCWMSDVHLDCVNDFLRWSFMERLRLASFDAALVTGDISTAVHIEDHLREIAKACAPRLVFFVPGNHDFFGSNIAAVEKRLRQLCVGVENLVLLGEGEVVVLSAKAALVGHKGWSDGQGGLGMETSIKSPDHDQIGDFQELPTQEQRFARMAALGAESARHFQKVLPYCLSWASHVVIGTHPPPFVQATRYRGRPCDPERLPHFTNVAAGRVIAGFAKRTSRRMTVLCGHTHFDAKVRFASTLTIRAAHVIRGEPAFELLNVDEVGGEDSCEAI